jgi:hypothetical protein
MKKMKKAVTWYGLNCVVTFKAFELSGVTHPVSVSAKAPIAAILNFILLPPYFLCCYDLCHRSWQTIFFQVDRIFP